MMMNKIRVGLMILGSVATPAVTGAEEYDLDSIGNAGQNRFVESSYVDGAYYLILDQQTGCKYLAYGSGRNFAMTPLIAADRKPDCSGPKGVGR